METNTQPVNNATPNVSDAEQNKAMAALAYVIFFIPLLAAKDSPFAKYHANQGLVLFLLSTAGFVVGSIVSGVIPFIGCLIMPALGFGSLIFAILGIMNAINLKMEPLPLIGGITIIK